ncbi:MAG: hypothetical protein KDD36_02860 [Flavobacteriales bacterium]|nr:hypothetical protein [Flavobacteriales bacterium]
MADPLEKLFRDQRAEFDQAEPPAGHLERFERRLKEDQHDQRKHGPGGNFFTPLSRIAAVLLIGFMLGYLYYANDPMGLNKAAQEQGIAQASLDLSTVSPELAEAKTFFDRMLREKMADLSPYKEKDSLMYKEIVDQLKGLEKDYNELSRDLAGNQTSEQVINAMIQNYRLRLDLIEHILNLKSQGEELKNTYEDENMES